MDTTYYTYAYLRIDGTPYYIGRGKNKRAFRKHGNIAVPNRERILFLKTNLTFNESCKHECYMIYVLGFKKEGGLLHNRTLGGEGSEFHFLTSEQKEKISKATLGKPKSISHRKKISKWRTGREMSSETKEKISKAHLSYDIPPAGKLTRDQKREIAKRFIFNSNSSELAIEYGVSRDHISRIARDPRWNS